MVCGSVWYFNTNPGRSGAAVIQSGLGRRWGCGGSGSGSGARRVFQHGQAVAAINDVGAMIQAAGTTLFNRDHAADEGAKTQAPHPQRNRGPGVRW